MSIIAQLLNMDGYFVRTPKIGMTTGSLILTRDWHSGLRFSGSFFVRWREGHFDAYDDGHIPVSNLYKVLILFAIIISFAFLSCVLRRGR